MNLQDILEAIRRKAFPKRYALEAELTELRAAHTHVSDELDAVRGELSETRAQDARQLTELQQQMTAIAAERKAAASQVHLLETSLAEAGVRQQDAEQQIRSLEKKLDDTRGRYEDSIGQTQETLLRLQTEQQNLLTLQTDLARTFHEVGEQLLASVQTRSSQPRQSMWQTAAMAGLLFLSGALLSGLLMRNDTQPVDIAPLADGMVDLQRLMQSHFGSYDELLKILKEQLERESAALQPESRVDPPSPATPHRLLERQRADLGVLGFDVDDIDSALAQFRMLYLPAGKNGKAPGADETDAVLGYFADQARKDRDRYRIDSEVLAAIRLASKRTGVEFPFLMELAATESSFNPAARASTSTAVGLYQFKEETWLETLKKYGSRYGLGTYSKRIQFHVDDKGQRRPSIGDPDLHTAALDLRLEPRASALLAGELVRRNKRQLSSSLDRTPGRTDLYLTHFLGASGAISFLKALASDPEKIALDIFPGPASRNISIFRNKARKPRTVAEIYKLFARKFDTDRFRDGESG